MRKRILAMIVFVGMLAGCGKTDVSTQPEPTKPAYNSAVPPDRFYDAEYGVVCYSWGSRAAIDCVKVDEGTLKLGR